LARTHANTDPVGFDFVAAQRLIAEFRNAAEALRSTQAARRTIAHRALTEWQGAFARQFAADLNTGEADAQRLARSFEEAADQVRMLVQSAEREQERRAQAQKYEEQQDRRSNIAKVGDKIEDLLGFGEEIPPPPEPVMPKPYVAPAVLINPGGLNAQGVTINAH
jgi:hypothetical protein